MEKIKIEEKDDYATELIEFNKSIGNWPIIRASRRTVGRYEKQILDALENKIYFWIQRQYCCFGYCLDGYCVDLNLALEIDEEFHYKDEFLNIKDLDRQNEIIKYMHCKFVRIRVSEIITDGKVDNEKLNNFINVEIIPKLEEKEQKWYRWYCTTQLQQ